MRRAVWAALLATLAAAGCKEPAPEGVVPATPFVRGDGGFVRPALDGDGGLKNVIVDPMDPESIYRAGQEAFVAGESDRAAEHFRTALRMKPSAKLWHALGDALMTQGRFGEAAEAFESAVKLEPTKHMSWARRGRCLANSGQPSAAAEAYRKALTIKPDDAKTVRDLADALVEARRDAEAIPELAKAAALDPSGAAKDHKLTGQLHGRNERWAEAIASFKESAKLHPDPGIFAELGEAQVRAADFDGALTSFEEAARLDPKDPLAPETAGEIKLRKGDVAGARAAFEASIAAKDRPYPHLAIGRMDLKEKKKDAAQAQLDKALAAAKGDDVPEIREIATFAVELGALESAEKLLAMLAGEEVNKKDVDLLLQLAKVKQLRKDAAGLKATCEQVKPLLPKDDKRTCPPK